MGKSNRKYEDISLKAFCKTRKGNEKTVCKIFMEVVGNPLLSTLTDKDFQNTIDAIDAMPKEKYTFSTRNSYKSILLNKLKKTIHEYTSQNAESKRDIMLSWKDVKQCDFRQKNSKNVMVCRNRKAPIKTTDLTPETCQLCHLSKVALKANPSISNEQPISGEDADYFPCSLLCKKFRGCTSNSMNIKSEIVENNCYVSKYPYEWRTPNGKYVRLCKFMFFAGDFPHDAENPYPQCIAKQKDIRIHLPKDRIMKNPQICWICVKLRKKAREEAKREMELKREQRIVSGAMRGKIYRGDSEGTPNLWRLGNY